jgi:hypothetical protein
MMVLYSQNAILGCEFSELRAFMENNAATNLRNHNVLNRNIYRIAMTPARCVAGPIAAGQHAAPAGPGNNLQPANVIVDGGTLSPLP